VTADAFTEGGAAAVGDQKMRPISMLKNSRQQRRDIARLDVEHVGWVSFNLRDRGKCPDIACALHLTCVSLRKYSTPWSKNQGSCIIHAFFPDKPSLKLGLFAQPTGPQDHQWRKLQLECVRQVAPYDPFIFI
jgi:hypothetical protein